MPYNARVIEVMVASPGDVAAEREVFREIVHDWNVIHARERSLVVLPVGWETHSSPRLGERPQEVINQQIVESCDLLVGIFWTRLGTPTGEAASGTVEEIEKHVNAGKTAMLYFSKAPVHIDSVDQAQYAALKAFRDEYMRRGLVEFYTSIDEFRDKFARQFAQTMFREFDNDEAVPGEVRDVTTSQGELTVEAQRLLWEAANGGGTVFVERYGGGSTIRANDTVIWEGPHGRDEARWEAVVLDLVQRGLLHARGESGEVFTVTDAGFRLADTLTPPPTA